MMGYSRGNRTNLHKADEKGDGDEDAESAEDTVEEHGGLRKR